MNTKLALIDTHAHIYDQKLIEDEENIVARWVANNVCKVLMPNVDVDTILPMKRLMEQYEECYGMMGLHPCSVNKDYQETLEVIYSELLKGDYIGIGEIGIDLYWDQTYVEEQIDAYRTQIRWAKELKLPIVIHSRESLELTIKIVEEEQDGSLSGIFHCFTGSADDAWKIIKMGCYLGIGGVYTFKNSSLKEDITRDMLDYIVLETDAPYLAPTPYRGKTNEPSYVLHVAEAMARNLGLTVEEVASITTNNANKLFF